MLLPPDLRDWVADNELARLILEAVELCDLQGASRNVRGSGSEQYPPTMMLALLIYCYASGTFSSRRIERATYDSIAVRYVCGNHHPDHDTIAHFRRHNGALFARCFATVVQLAREAGLLKLAAISIDGTRLAGAASKRSVRTLAQIEAELQELESQGGALLAQAEAADRSDLDAGGTQLPPELANAQVRREKLRSAKAQIQERRQRAVEAGRQDGPHSARRTSKVSLSEPESRMLRTAGDGSLQGYNAQVAADAGQSGLILGQHLSDETTDYGLVGDGVTSVVAEAGQPRMVLVDKGYFEQRTHRPRGRSPPAHDPLPAAASAAHPGASRPAARPQAGGLCAAPEDANAAGRPLAAGALPAACRHRRTGLRPHQEAYGLYPIALLGPPRRERRMDLGLPRAQPPHAHRQAAALVS